MKITCQSCQSKYTIADDKVAGKTVKIKCKKCGATIVVNGNDAAALAAPPAAMHAAHGAQGAPGDGEDEGEGETRVFGQEASAALGSAGDEWTVNVADDDQRTLSGAQIVVEYHRGVITADTYVWKDGMADWLPLSGVPELMALVSGGAERAAAPRPAAGAPVAAAAVAAAPIAAAPIAAAPAAHDDSMGLGGTVMMEQSPAVSPLAARGSSPALSSSPQAAARRTGGSSGVDVFSQRQAAEAPPPGPSASANGLIGERNENSVLFSLSALSAAESAARAGSTRPEPAQNNGGRGGLDDIMNLGGGGIAGGPMLAPPPLLAPVVEAPPPPMPAAVPSYHPPAGGAGMSMPPGASMVPDMPAQKKSPVGLIVGILAGVLVLGGVGAFFAMKGGDDQTQATNEQAQVQASSTPSAAATPTPTAEAPKPADTGATAAVAPTDTGKPAEAATPTPQSGPVAAVGGPKPAAGGSGPAKPAETAKPVETAKPAEPAKPAETAAPAAGGAEFNRAAAMSALSGAAGAARGCKKPDGPTGSGRVKVTFAPSGNVTSATVQGAPFAGTPVGGCVASAFRSAHVPPFSGSPVSVTKSFNIN